LNTDNNNKLQKEFQNIFFRMNKIGLIARRPIQNILIRFSGQKFTNDYDVMVNANKCVVFMKGTPEAPNCGFSRAVIQMLEAEGADFKEVDTHNILADEIMREELKEYSDWPTFPQVYLQGEFFAGCDIMYEAYQKDELRKELLDAQMTLPAIE